MGTDSEKRFKHVNHLCDHVIRHLNPSQGLLLFIGWRHADKLGVFTLSHSRMAKHSGLSVRHVKRVVAELVARQALKVLEEGGGTRPATYKITGKWE
jgi:hypothetical protein